MEGKKNGKNGKKTEATNSIVWKGKITSQVITMEYTEIWKGFSERYFTQPILAIAELLAIAIGLKYCRKDKYAKLFIAFLLFDFLILLIDWHIGNSNAISKSFVSKFIKITNILISIFEITAYYYFFSGAIKSKNKNIAFVIPPLVYTIIATMHISNNFKLFCLSKNQISYILYSLELALLLPLIIIFFFQLINTNHETILFSRPSFWIAVGIFFQSVISIPCYLLLSYLLMQKTEFMPFIEASLYYTPLIINVLFISKAFLCKKTLTI